VEKSPEHYSLLFGLREILASNAGFPGASEKLCTPDPYRLCE
jgi:hypothetical protein